VAKEHRALSTMIELLLWSGCE